MPSEPNAKILIVDDEESILSSIRRFLEKKGFQVMVAKEATSALMIAQEAAPDIVLTDSQLPGLDGHKLCRMLKKDSRTARIPVILMSGVWKSENETISGLEGGADDYVYKPLSLNVLYARIAAVLRRFAAPPKETGSLLKDCGLTLDSEARSVALNGRQIRLTGKEFDLLLIFMQKPGRILKPAFLLEAVWGYDPAVYNDTHTVEVHVSSLRKKLGKEFGARMVNVIGFGYKLERRHEAAPKS